MKFSWRKIVGVGVEVVGNSCSSRKDGKIPLYNYNSKLKLINWRSVGPVPTNLSPAGNFRASKKRQKKGTKKAT